MLYPATIVGERLWRFGVGKVLRTRTSPFRGYFGGFTLADAIKEYVSSKF